MEIKVMPIENTISCDCDCWVKVGSGNVNHEGLNEVLDFIEKYLPDHSDRENIDLFLLRYKEKHHTAIPEFSILLAHYHFEHPKTADDMQILATVLRMIELEICEHLGGYAELKYLNTHREKMIIELTGITDYDLIQEIVENGGGWQTENYGGDSVSQVKPRYPTGQSEERK